MVGEGRPSTSLLAKGWVFLPLSEWPALWLQSKKVGHGGRGGMPEITEENLHPHFSAHSAASVLKYLQSHRPAVLDQIGR
jgi:hypothetical protein